MARHTLSDSQFDRLAPLLPGKVGDRGRSAASNRRFLDAVLFVAKTGCPWRDLPPALGNWNSTWRRFDRWAKRGVWQRIFESLACPEAEWLLLDSTSVKAHQNAAGAQKRGSRMKRRRPAKPLDALAAA